MAGNPDQETAALPLLANNLDAATVGFNYSLGDGQAQAGSAVLAGSGRIAPIKTVKNVGQVFRADAFAIIAYHQRDPFFFLLSRNFYLTALPIGMLDRIVEEVQDHLFDLVNIKITVQARFYLQ